MYACVRVCACLYIYIYIYLYYVLMVQWYIEVEYDVYWEREKKTNRLHLYPDKPVSWLLTLKGIFT